MNVVTHLDVPMEWRVALARIRQHFPEAVIAGGALRDLLNQRPVKDIDVFIDGAGVCRSSEVKVRLIDEFSVVPKMVVNPEFCEYSVALDGVEFAMEMDLSGGGIDIPVQVVGLTKPVTLFNSVERFDFGICRVAFDGRTVYRAPEFIRDQKQQTFTLIRCENNDQFGRSIGRYDRLQAKYQGWELIDNTPFPDEADGWGDPNDAFSDL